MRISKSWVGVKSLLCALGVSVFMGSAAQAAAIFDIPSVSGFRNDSWSFGEIFTVGGSDINVTAIGALDVNGDGFVSQDGIPVGIFREVDDVLLASTTVTSTDTLIDGFRYANISPLTLLSGVSYRVVAVNRDDLYNISSSFTVDPAVSRTGYGYCRATVLTSCDAFTGDRTIWMANLMYGGEVTPTPAPAALGLFGLGVFGLGALARRRKKA